MTGYGTYGSSLRDLPRLRNSRRLRESSWDRKGGNDDFVLKAGETIMLADIAGAGSINHIWMTVEIPNRVEGWRDGHSCAKKLGGFGGRVVDNDVCAFGEQGLDDRDRRRFTRVVGIRAKGDAEHGDAAAGERGQVLVHQLDHLLMLIDVDIEDCAHHPHRYASRLTVGGQRAHVLG